MKMRVHLRHQLPGCLEHGPAVLGRQGVDVIWPLGARELGRLADKLNDGRLPVVARGAEVKSVDVIVARHVLRGTSRPDGIRLKVLKALVDAAVWNLDVDVGDAEGDGRRRSV